MHDVHVVGGEDDAFRYLESRAHREAGAFVVDAFDPRHAAVVENHGKAADEMLGALRGSQATCGPAPRDHVRIEEYSARSVALHVDAGCGGVLVLPDVYFPGWTATVNGEDRTVHATDGAFRGVVVPKGASRVEFRYEPRAFRIGTTSGPPRSQCSWPQVWSRSDEGGRRHTPSSRPPGA